jgi:hypothetical protein
MDLRDPDATIALFDRAAATMRSSPLRRGSTVRLPATGRLLATGDLHDNPIHLDRVVRLARLDAGPDRHVVLHELIHGDRLVNGMDFSHRMLGRVAMLVVDHPLQVHPMLGNHEIAQATNTGVSKGAGNSVVLFDEALEYAYADAWESVAAAIDRFIAAMALAVVSESGVMCAHSLPGPHRMERFDPGILDRELGDDDFRGPDGSAYMMTWGRRYTDESIEPLVRAWGIRLFCLGHEHTDAGIEARGDRVLIINSDHDRATTLPIDLARPPSVEEAIMTAVPLASVGD